MIYEVPELTDFDAAVPELALELHQARFDRGSFFREVLDKLFQKHSLML